MAPQSNPERKTLEMVNRTWVDYSRGLDVMIGGMQLWDIRERNGRRYLGEHHDRNPKKGMQHATINRIANAITTTVAVQTEQPWRLRLTPRESSEDPQYFLTNSGIRKLQAAQANGGIQLQDFMIDNITSDREIDAAHGEAIETLTKPITQPDGTTIPPILEEDKDLIKLTDAKAAEQLQLICTALLDRAFVDYYTMLTEVNSNITGDQMIIFQWDNDSQECKFTVPNWTNYRFDPRSSWVKDARGVMYQETMPARDAIEEFPEFAKDIEDSLQKGYGFHPSTYTTGGAKEGGSPSFFTNEPNSDQSQPIDEAFVTIRTLWKRNHLFPISEDNPEIEEGMDNLGNVSGKSSEDLEESKQGEQGDAKKPKGRMGIRQITTLVEAERVVEDIECPYADIPAPWAKNIIIPNSPYGMGEPFRQEDIQLLINRIMTMILNVLRYHAYPMEVMPLSLKDVFTRDGEDWSAHPGRVTWLEDDQWQEYIQKGGLRGFLIDAPSVPDSWVRTLQMLLNEQQRLAGDTDVVQGQLPSPDTSGVAIEVLQASGTRTMALKAKSLEWTFEWIGRLLLDSVIEWLEDSEWDKYSMQYGGAVRSALRSRSKGLDYDVRVEAVAGRAAARKLDAQKSENLYDRGSLTKETLLEMHEIPDPRGELLRKREELVAELAAQSGQIQGGDQPQAAPAPRQAEGTI